MVGSERLGRMEAQADTPGFRGPGPVVGAKDMRLVQENSFGFLGMARIPSGRSIGGWGGRRAAGPPEADTDKDAAAFSAHRHFS